MSIEDRVGTVERAFDSLETEVYRLRKAVEGRFRGSRVVPCEEIRRATLRFKDILRLARRGVTSREYAEYHSRKERDMR